MITEKDVHVPHRGESWLSANIYRPDDSDQKPIPVITSIGPYNKDLHLSDADPFEARLLAVQGRETLVYERFEGEQWVEFGYAVVHLDVPGIGKSPGVLDVFSKRDYEYYYDAIEWLAKQPWCDGKVASCGLSYHSITSMGVATLNPPSLKAIIAWEVGIDIYRDFCYPGGIRNSLFEDWWFEHWVKSQQTGRSSFSEDELAKNRVEFVELSKEHPHIDDWWRERSPRFEDIKVPFFTVANFCGHPLSTGSHFRLLDESSTPKDKQWLEIIAGKHVAPMYEKESILCQKRFLDHFLKNKNNGWDKVPRIKYTIRGRYGYKSFLYDSRWPPADTQRTTFALDASAETDSAFTVLATAKRPSFVLKSSSAKSLPESTAKYHNESDEQMFVPVFPYAEYVLHMAREKKRPGSAVAFITPSFEKKILVAGQSTLTLFVSLQGSSDTDMFLGLRYISKDGHEILFDGILDSPNLLVGYGHQRLSLRKIDTEISHDDYLYIQGTTPEPVKENEIVKVRVMLSPISVIVEKGGRLMLEISSRNVENSYCYILNDPKDRKMGGEVTIHTGGAHPSELILPLQPVDELGMPEGL